jgi:hypothetical protein
VDNWLRERSRPAAGVAPAATGVLLNLGAAALPVLDGLAAPDPAGPGGLAVRAPLLERAAVSGSG